MQVIIKENYDEMSKEAGQIIKDAMHLKPNLVLGLATGSTPIGTYKELIRMYKEGELDFSKVVTFNLDEYVGLPTTHEQSYHYFMHDNLFNHINISSTNIHVPSGIAKDFAKYCQWYEDEIEKVDGVDLQVLGIGSDGHIGFNEPGTSLASRTSIVTLTEETIKDNARFFERESDVPRFAITMGVGTIMEAKCCLLVANGEKKADPVSILVEGPITSQVTASALQMHPNAIVIIDKAAASKLKRIDYYNWAYENRPKF
ncbi:MAG: Glucosamine-6-phosphate deaminase [Candidatus Poribacteria bacterium]|nr:Glucosamine-6-phosphate deaminase [Candidatus Poribacteria bacterium]MDQ1328185.1 Glucosamine-6-phosphate deaminase [Candidatus Poribacteria bacterium]